MPKVYRLYRYAVFLFDRFKYLLALALFVFVVATAVLYTSHPQQRDPTTRTGLGEVAFGVFELMFAAEPALPYPQGSLPSQVVFFALPVLNMLALAAAVAQFSQILFDRGLYNRAQANNADGHVILCGLGRLGREVLRQLDQRHHMKRRRDVVVVESGSGDEAIDGLRHGLVELAQRLGIGIEPLGQRRIEGTCVLERFGYGLGWHRTLAGAREVAAEYWLLEGAQDIVPERYGFALLLLPTSSRRLP